jgi:tetratricopeptide (TPR) repeat protein
MTTDLRGVPVSTTNPAALALFEEAVQQYQTYVGDAVATLDRAIAAQPDFVLAHAARAGVLMTFSEQRFAAQARDTIAAAEALVDGANERERGIVAACRLLVDGDWNGACAAFDRVLVEHPRDVFTIQTAHLFDFFRGDTLNLRNRITRVLPAWDASVPGYSFVLGMHAFGLEENNQYADALATASRALAIEPRDAWSVHAGVHVMEMRGEIEAGVDWLETRERDWVPDNGLAYHLWWHLALFHLDRGDTARVLELFDRRIYPEPSDLSLQLVDASSLLWRLHVLGEDVRSRFDQLAAAWEAKLDAERGFYAFNDVHAMMAFAATGREAACGQVLHDLMDAAATRTHANARMAREVGLPVAHAIVAFVQGRYDDVIARLEPVRDIANVFGGSHAQRDLLSITLVEAALRGGRKSVARHYLAERTVSRPASALGWRLQARAAEGRSGA